jgi:hypothetical protein
MVAASGLHKFFVRAIDRDGNQDDSPAQLSFYKVEPAKGQLSTIVDSTLGPQLDSLQLYLPPTALPAGSSIRLNPVAVDFSAAAKQSLSLDFTGIAFALALQPEKRSFITKRPMTLKIFYDDSLVAQKFDQDKLVIYRWEGGWVPLGGVVGAEPPVIATTITQLDTFALFEKIGAIREPSTAGLVNLAVQPRILSAQYGQTVTISFDLGNRAEVTAKVYNLAGRLVETVCENLPMNPGRQPIEWNGRDQSGNPCPSGLYIICVQASGQTATKTVMVVNK